MPSLVPTYVLLLAMVGVTNLFPDAGLSVAMVSSVKTHVTLCVRPLVTPPRHGLVGWHGSEGALSASETEYYSLIHQQTWLY